MLRWDAPLFFANAELFSQRVHDSIAESPTNVRRVVIAAEPITSVDITSSDSLHDLAEQLKADGIELNFAEMKDPVKDKLIRFGLFSELGERNFFPTIESAVVNHLRALPSGPRHAELALAADR